MTTENKIQTLGKELRRLSSITDYITKSEIEISKINSEIAEKLYQVKMKIQKIQLEIEKVRKRVEANIRFERMTKAETEHYNKVQQEIENEKRHRTN